MLQAQNSTKYATNGEKATEKLFNIKVSFWCKQRTIDGATFGKSIFKTIIKIIAYIACFWCESSKKEENATVRCIHIQINCIILRRSCLKMQKKLNITEMIADYTSSG